MSAVRSVLPTARLALTILMLAWSSATVHAQESFVQVSAEPKHRMKMDTAKYRVYDVLVEPGEPMLFHEHKADIFAVVLSESDLTNEFQDGKKTDVSVKAGIVAFTAASPSKSYVHRVLLRGGAPFRNITIELLQPQAPPVTAEASEQVDAALTTVREAPRGKAYRLNLEPNQTTKLPSRVSDIFVVCLSDGSVVQTSGQSSTNWACKVGDFRLLEQPREVALKNQAASRADLILIALQ